MPINNYPYVTLALQKLFTHNRNEYCSYFMPFPDVFKIFHSYSRDLHGTLCASGDCVSKTDEGIQNFISICILHHVTYFQLT